MREIKEPVSVVDFATFREKAMLFSNLLNYRTEQNEPKHTIAYNGHNLSIFKEQR